MPWQRQFAHEANAWNSIRECETELFTMTELAAQYRH